jgi:predicted nucleotidyltransferase
MSREPIERFFGLLAEQAAGFYGDRLVSLAVFGSHASGRARPGSDLDVLIVLSEASARRRLRLDEFDRLEERLAGALASLDQAGWPLDLSPVIRTRDEAEGFSVLYLDMTVDVRVLIDRGEFLRRRLNRLRARLEELGARRQPLDGGWYWVLKEDYRPGEVFEI